MASANSTIKAGQWTYTSQEFDQMCDEAKRRGEAELRANPLATSVRYDRQRGNVVIKLNNGCTLTVPTRLLEGLRDAAPRDLKQVKIMGPGLAIEWPTLDMQFTIRGLLAGVFGTQTWMEELGRPRKKLPSPSKARAARRNGRKSARPRKAQDESASQQKTNRAN